MLTSIIEPHSPTRSILLVGDYGSGKTEVSVNLVLRLKRELPDRHLAIADLDLVNPYFRCREAREPLDQAGIDVVMPQGSHAHADLPILLPQVKGLLQDTERMSVLDVGGDEVGSRVLAGISDAIDPERHELWFVANANRPFNDTVAGVLKSIRGIENASRIRVTGLVSNTHMMTETTPEMVAQGRALLDQVAATLQIPVRFTAVMADLADAAGEGALPGPLLIMHRLMTPPWIARDVRGAANTAQTP